MAGNESKVEDLGRAAMQAQHARASAAPLRRRSFGARSAADTVANLVAIFLCLVNALVWAFVSGLPLVGILWLVAAAACVRLQAWARG